MVSEQSGWGTKESVDMKGCSPARERVTRDPENALHRTARAGPCTDGRPSGRSGPVNATASGATCRPGEAAVGLKTPGTLETCAP